MAFGLGALLGLSGINAISGLASSGVQYLANKSLQEQAQAFNSLEALKSRNWSSLEAATNRGFQAQEAELARQWQAQEASTARQWQHDEAEIARQWNLNLENTKYQRMINDMKAAGINPASIGMTSASSPVVANVPNAASAPGAAQVSSVGSSSGASASSGASSIAVPNFGNTISSAFNIALGNSFKDERFAKEMLERTAYEAQKIEIAKDKLDLANKYYRAYNKSLKRSSDNNNVVKRKEPQWLKSYVKNFESGVTDL